MSKVFGEIGMLCMMPATPDDSLVIYLNKSNLKINDSLESYLHDLICNLTPVDSIKKVHFGIIKNLSYNFPLFTRMRVLLKMLIAIIEFTFCTSTYNRESAI